MMKNIGMTVNDLLNECIRLKNEGYGDKCIQISSDDEGNSYHSLFFTFVTNKNEINLCSVHGLLYHLDKEDLDKIVLLG